MKNLILFIAVIFSIQGFSQNGYTEYDTRDQASPLFPTTTSCITFDDSGNTWIGQGDKFHLLNNIGKGIIKWNGSTFSSITMANSKLISDNVYDIVCQGNTLWIGTKEGLQRFDNKGNASANWKHFDSLDDRGLGKQVVSLKIIDNDLWIGSDSGCGVLNLSTLVFTHFSSTLWGVSKTAVRAFEKGKNSEIWIGTDSGLVKKSGANFTLHKETYNVLALIWDDNNELWAGGGGGIFRIKNNTVEPAVDINNCFANPGIYTITQFIRDKNYNVILAAGQSESYPPANPVLITLPSQKLQKYYVRSGANFVSSRYMAYGLDRSGNIFMGFWMNKLFKITDVKELPNDGENLRKIIPDNPKNLDINQVNATMLNRGDMFWDLINTSKYEVPKGSCKKPLFASALWIGGIAPANSLHLAAMTYRQGGSDYYPGPLDTVTGKGDMTANTAYNRIWKVSRWEIEELKQKHADGSLANGSYTPGTDILDWPAHGTGNHSRRLAPFTDINNNGVYEPLEGDYPKIKGEQTLYWIFNDNTDIHTETSAKPLGVEIHAMAYAYNCDTIKPGSPNEALNFTTFYEYRIINRSSIHYEDTYFGAWSDVDLGNSSDDYVGCHPEGNFAYVYNGDNDDQGPAGYGVNPPMLSIVFLSDTMTNFMAYGNDFSIAGNPTLARHYYGYLSSTWKDETFLTYGGNGHNTGASTNLMFSGIPYTPGEWNEASIATYPGDRRFVQSTGRHTLAPGAVKTFSYAIVFSHEPNKPNGLTTSWLKNMNDVNTIKSWHAAQSFPACLTKPNGLSAQEPEINGDGVTLYPNPSSGQAVVEFTLKSRADVTLEVYNMLGQVVYSSQNSLAEGKQVLPLDISSQSAGMYFYVLKAADSQYSGKFIKLGE